MRKRRNHTLEPLEKRQLLSVYLNGLDNNNMGKGMWAWDLNTAMGHDGFASGNYSGFFTYLRGTQGMNYVIVKAADGDNLFTNSGGAQNYSSAIIAAAHTAGLKLLPYFYIYGGSTNHKSSVVTSITGEINIFNTVVDTYGADGVVFDIEDEYLGATGGTAAAIQQYFAGIGKSRAGDGTASRDNLFMAYSSFPYPSLHSGLPWTDLGDYCDATMPQAYWAVLGSSPTASSCRSPTKGQALTGSGGPSRMVKDVDSEYRTRSLESTPRTNTWWSPGAAPNYTSNSIKPVIMTGQSYGTATGADLTEFFNAVKADTTAVGVNMPGTYTPRSINFFDENGVTTGGSGTKAAIAAGAIGDPPTAVTSPSPANGATNVSPTGLVLDWADSTPLLATSYDVYLDGALKTNVASSSWTISPAIGGGSHTWRIDPRNLNGPTTGATWSFTAQFVLPGTPASPNPANNAILTTAPTKLDWADASDATNYDVYLGTIATPFNTTISELAVTPSDGVRLWRVVAKNASGNTNGPQWQYTLDRVAPAASYGGQTPTSGTSYLDFTVTYTDATTGVNYLSLDGGDVTVTGPNSYSAAATLVSVDSLSNGSPRIATYRIPAPGGTWDTADDGAYTILQNVTQVKDVAGNYRAAGSIGSFGASLAFAYKSGSVLFVNYDGSGQAIRLADNGGNIDASMGATTLDFSGVTSVTVTGTAGDDVLNYNGTIAAPIQFDGGNGNDALNVLAGTYTLSSDANIGASALSISVAGGASAVFNSAEHLAGLTVAGGASVISDTGALAVAGDVANAGTLDIDAGAAFNGANFSNTGTLNANGGVTAIAGAVAQQSGSALTAGTWNVADGATLSIATGADITDNQATISLTGAGASFSKVDSLETNSGVFELHNRSFGTAGSLANTGTLVVDNSTLTVNGDFAQSGSLDVHSTLTVSVSATFNGTNTFGPGSVFNAGVGASTFNIDAGANLAVNASAGTLIFNVSEHLAALNLTGGAVARLAAGGDRYLDLSDLSIDETSTLDMNDNDIIVSYGTNASAFAAVQGWVFAGYSAAVDPSKTGIISSAGQTAGNTILALVDNALLGASEWPLGSGNTIYGNSVIGKYTYFGDANFDGQVTADDYGVLDANFGTTPPVGMTWLSGDTNLDGSVTSDDYGILDANFGSGAGSPLSPARAPASLSTASTRNDRMGLLA